MLGEEIIPQTLLGDLSANHLNGRWHYSAETLTAEKGAYALLLQLSDELIAELPRQGSQLLQPGWYIYAGSARGPGGLPARLRRHFLQDKRKHWHIDQLTARATVLAAQAVPEGDECDVAAWLSASFAFDIAAPGFGSTDCPICPSHLLVWRPPGQRPV